jgi:O-antigen/teichoic acid export membrane protein
MSRLRKAATTAGFAYVNFGAAIVAGIVLVPLTLRYVGARPWGLWLATGELLGYAGMLDLGVLGVLPWMIAEADGRRDRGAIGRLVGHGLSVGILVGVLYGAAALVLWIVAVPALGVPAADRALLGPPLIVLVLVNAVSYPLRVFRAVVAGLQDAWFLGVMTLVATVTGIVVTIVMLTRGYGLHALALAAVVPTLVTGGASLARVLCIAPDALRGWVRPSWAGLRPLLANGTGVWLGAVGWHLLAASNALVLTYLGHPEWVVVYSCTAKLATTATQLAWVLPDSGLVGLAQLHGEGQPAGRVRDVVVMLLRLHLLLAGAAACGLLAFNPSFVTAWVGGDFFGGTSLNVLLSAGILLSSLVHGLITAASVVGNRLMVGVVTVVNGVVQVGLGLVMTHAWGLRGLAAAALLAALITSLPAGLRLLKPSTAITIRLLAADLIRPWIVRVAPLVVIAFAAGALNRGLGIWTAAAVSAGIGLGHLWHMRPLYHGLPLDARWSRWLVSLRLMPAMPPVAGAEQP